jgi:tetratricopeptide (TPR) repeat protein
MRHAFINGFITILSVLALDPSATFGQGIERRVGTKVIFKKGKGQLRIDDRTLDLGSGFRVFTVEHTNGDWIWIKAGSFAGWAQSSELVTFDLAVEYYTNEIERGPTSAAYINRGLVWGEMRAFDKAINDFTEAIGIDPKNPIIYNNRGAAWSSRLDHDRAIADYTEAIRLDPKNAAIYNNRGAAWSAKQNPGKAIADFNEAIRIDPSFTVAYKWRAKAWQDTKEFDKAIEDYTQVIRLDPKNLDAYLSRSSAWSLKQQPDKAIADYSQAMQIDPKNATACFNRGLAWQGKGELEKALADYDETIRLEPRHTKAYIRRASVCWFKNAYDKALADYDEVIRIDPNQPDAYNAKAWLLATCADAKYRDGKQAVEAANRANELSDGQDWRCVDTLAAAYAEAGDFDAAVKWQEKALQLVPKTERGAVEVATKQLALYREKMPYREQPSPR